MLWGSTAHCVKLSGEDLSQQISSFKKMSVLSLS